LGAALQADGGNEVRGNGLKHQKEKRSNAAGQRRHAIRIACGHAEDDLLRPLPERWKQLVLDDILNLIGIEHGNKDAAARAGELVRYSAQVMKRF
jgi:hypothetical protein